MTDRLVIHNTPKEKTKPRTSTVIRISGPASEVLEGFAERSNLTKYELASRMILFASERLEIVEHPIEEIEEGC